MQPAGVKVLSPSPQHPPTNKVKLEGPSSNRESKMPSTKPPFPYEEALKMVFIFAENVRHLPPKPHTYETYSPHVVKILCAPESTPGLPRFVPISEKSVVGDLAALSPFFVSFEKKERIATWPAGYGWSGRLQGPRINSMSEDNPIKRRTQAGTDYSKIIFELQKGEHCKAIIFFRYKEAGKDGRSEMWESKPMVDKKPDSPHSPHSEPSPMYPPSPPGSPEDFSGSPYSSSPTNSSSSHPIPYPPSMAPPFAIAPPEGRSIYSVEPSESPLEGYGGATVIGRGLGIYDKETLTFGQPEWRMDACIHRKFNSYDLPPQLIIDIPRYKGPMELFDSTNKVTVTVHLDPRWPGEPIGPPLTFTYFRKTAGKRKGSYETELMDSVKRMLVLLGDASNVSASHTPEWSLLSTSLMDTSGDLELSEKIMAKLPIYCQMITLIITKLLSAEATKWNVVDDATGSTVLHEACRLNLKPSVILTLQAKAPSLNRKDNNGMMPFECLPKLKSLQMTCLLAIQSNPKLYPEGPLHALRLSTAKKISLAKEPKALAAPVPKVVETKPTETKKTPTKVEEKPSEPTKTSSGKKSKKTSKTKSTSTKPKKADSLSKKLAKKKKLSKFKQQLAKLGKSAHGVMKAVSPGINSEEDIVS
eukprot:TRINITY_DN4199_c1_g1_i1.p1 TRINITY_DN4199_c1_g1~~TRINITY_DN4199_c1_g1_i1.p1  ORF type:complete len:644 (-),score=103.40 TRINITY_DN4199_c1_g1_i1:72-2003(-)